MSYPKVINEDIQYEGVVYKSVRKTIEMSDGVTIKRDVITKPACVVALVRHIDRNIAIIAQEFRVGSMKEEYGFPAGFIDKDESPTQAVVREVTEETGYTPTNVVYLGKSLTSSGFTDEVIHHFYIEVNGEPEEQSLDHDEKINLMATDFEDLPICFETGMLNGNHAHATYLKYLLKYNMIKELN